MSERTRVDELERALRRIAHSQETDLSVYARFAEEVARDALDEKDLPIGALFVPASHELLPAEFNAHVAQHRLPCPDDEPMFYRYADGCTIERFQTASGAGSTFTPSVTLPTP